MSCKITKGITTEVTLDYSLISVSALSPFVVVSARTSGGRVKRSMLYCILCERKSGFTAALASVAAGEEDEIT